MLPAIPIKGVSGLDAGIQALSARMLGDIMSAPTAAQAAELMGVAMQSEHWRIRDLATKACTTVITQLKHRQLDYDDLFSLLACAASDTSPHVRAAAVEGMAALSSRMGIVSFLKVLHFSKLNNQMKQLIRRRLDDPAPPSLLVAGVGQHDSSPSTRQPLPTHPPIQNNEEEPHTQERSSAPNLQAKGTSKAAGQLTEQFRKQRNDRRTTDGSTSSEVQSRGAQGKMQAWAPLEGLRTASSSSSSRKLAVSVFDYSTLAADSDASPHSAIDLRHMRSYGQGDDSSTPEVEEALGTPGWRLAPGKRLSDVAGCKLDRLIIPAIRLGSDAADTSPLSMHSLSQSPSPVEPPEDLRTFALPSPFSQRTMTDPGNMTLSPDKGVDHRLPHIKERLSGPQGQGQPCLQPGNSISEEEDGSNQGHDSGLAEQRVSRSASLERLKQCQLGRSGWPAAGAALSTPASVNQGGKPLSLSLTASPFAGTWAFTGFKVSEHQSESASPGIGGKRGSLSGLEACSVGKRAGSLSSQELVYKGATHQDKADDILFENLLPHRDAERAMQAALAVMQAANVADRKELDWQGQNEALNDCRRLIKHHPTLVSQHLFELVTASLPAIDALRSFTAKIALVMYQELFSQLGQAMDAYVGNVAAMLLKRAAEVSNAGRENFLSLEARAALGDMCHNVSSGRAMSALLVNANHKSPSVRVCVAQHLDLVLDLARRELVLWPPPASNWAVMERLFKVVLGFLSEGALETRTFGKRLLWSLKQMLSAAELSKLMSLQQPGAAAQRKLQETVEAMTEQPPLPHSSALGSAASSQPGAGAGAGAGACRVPAPSPRLLSNAAQIPELRTPSLSPSPDHSSSCISASSRPLASPSAELCTLTAAEFPSPVHPGPKALPPPPGPPHAG